MESGAVLPSGSCPRAGWVLEKRQDIMRKEKQGTELVWRRSGHPSEQPSDREAELEG